MIKNYKKIVWFLVLGMAIFSCKKPAGSGGNSQISGHVSIYDHTSSRAEVTDLTFVHGADIKDDEYILLNTPEGRPNYYVWFSSAAGGDPGFPDRTVIPVTFTASQNSSVLANSTMNAINNVASVDLSAAISGDILTLTNLFKGESVDNSNGTTPIDMDVTVQGKNYMLTGPDDGKNTNVYLIYGDDAIYSKDFTTDPSGNYLFTGLTKGKYTVFAYSKDTVSGVDDIKMVEVEITKNKQNIDAEDLLIIK